MCWKKRCSKLFFPSQWLGGQGRCDSSTNHFWRLGEAVIHIFYPNTSLHQSQERMINFHWNRGNLRVAVCCLVCLWKNGALRQIYWKIDELSSSRVSPDQSGSQSNSELKDSNGKPAVTLENNIQNRGWNELTVATENLLQNLLTLSIDLVTTLVIIQYRIIYKLKNL